MSKEFEIARLLVVAAARRDECDRGLGFAWSSRIYPFFHEYRSTEAFAEEFIVSREQVKAIIEHIDKQWLAKESFTFYELEQKFGDRWSGNGKIDRGKLIDVCRYAFLSRRFDQSLWQALTVEGSGPVESQGLADEFDPIDDLRVEF